MPRPDKKLLLLFAFLLLAITAMGLIWWYYDQKLRAMEQHQKALKLNTD